MPRKQHSYHFIYKTVCLITNRFYYGMHSTSNLDDGYLGSGKYLWHSINKHGKENHKIEILEYLDDRKDLAQRERELITEDLLKDPLCMNLQLGGGGGFSSKEQAANFHRAGGIKVLSILRRRHLEKLKTDPEYKKKYSESMSKSQTGEGNGFYGRKHSDETKEKMKLSRKGKQVGKLNSQYGKRWITNEQESKKINKGDLIPEGWRLGRKIKTKNTK